MVYNAGERDVPTWLVLKGSIAVARRDGLNHETAITILGPGQFSGEVSQLAGAATLAAASAGPEGCNALPFDATHVRALMIGPAELGEIMMRAFILRRVSLIEEGGVGAVLVGRSGTPELVRLQGFLGRNGYPYTVLDVSNDPEGRAVVERSGVLPEELPLVVCPNGMILKRPTDAEAGAILGITPELDPERVYDVAIVGAGPAGLAAAVYAGSEGLSVLVLDQRAFGGQAGASARIENYLGFPTGISVTLSHIPILIEFGDFSPVPQPSGTCLQEISQITGAGGDIRFAWIPALPDAITGSDHMIMDDNNNLQIADILIGWATSRGL
jgi:thioredoxin reductase (NADPH)